MIAIIQRILIVAWILVGLGVTLGFVFVRPVVDMVLFCPIPALAVWALQFILTGIVNPLKLLANPDGKPDHD
jgi:hypothetical protein